jgi:hypothetical protein
MFTYIAIRRRRFIAVSAYSVGSDYQTIKKSLLFLLFLYSQHLTSNATMVLGLYTRLELVQAHIQRHMAYGTPYFAQISLTAGADFWYDNILISWAMLNLKWR